MDLAECDMPRMPITDEHGLHNYRVWLQTIFHERCRRNPAYSLRSFARSLGVSHPSLSQILSGKRPLTQKSAFVIANRLALPPNQRRQLLALAQAPGQSGEFSDDYLVLEMDQFQLISEWHHYAILCVLEIEGSFADPAWIATRLGIDKRESAAALERLERLGLIRDGKLLPQRERRNVATPTETSPALRNAHRENLKKAEEVLETVGVESRDASYITMAIDPALIPKAKMEIRRFRRALARQLESGNKSRVYTLAIHLFPVDSIRSAQ